MEWFDRGKMVILRLTDLGIAKEPAEACITTTLATITSAGKES